MSLLFKCLFGAFFVVGGAFHFFKTSLYLKMMPPYLPFPNALVLISGLMEMVLGILLFVKKTGPIAAWGIILLLVAIFPANIHMALHPEIFPEIPVWIRWARLPLQGVLMLWAYRYAV